MPTSAFRIDLFDSGRRESLCGNRVQVACISVFPEVVSLAMNALSDGHDGRGGVIGWHGRPLPGFAVLNDIEKSDNFLGCRRYKSVFLEPGRHNLYLPLSELSTAL